MPTPAYLNVIAQNRGVENAVVSAACKKAAEQFLKMLNDSSGFNDKSQQECA